MKARIYIPGKTALQSGRGKANLWHIEFFEGKASYQEPVMGWVGGRCTRPQVNLTFQSAEEAAGYLKRQGIEYRIYRQEKEVIRGKKYADNFSPYHIL